jgi:N-acyl-D-amino-acid deacylase
VALASASAEYDGLYISHLRSEGQHFLEALQEFFTILSGSGSRGEIYHLKASGRANWHKLDEVIERIETKRKEGVAVTADMYTYHAASTGLDIIMPNWVQEGGHDAWVGRLRDPAVRQRLIDEITSPVGGPEYSFHESGAADNILLTAFKSESLKPLTGKTLAEIAVARGSSPLETAFDLIIEDDSRVGAIYFIMSEENVRKKIALPWVSFCSDSASLAPQGVFLKSNPHPRAYGSFARLLGKYVRQEGVISLQEAVRRLSALPASNLKLARRGRLAVGYYADIVVFDPATIQDRATFTHPHQYATGMVHVLVNGTQVLLEGQHTGATPGQVVRGPGARTSGPAQ